MLQSGVLPSVGLLLGGLALFLFGLELMSDGLKALAASRLQGLLGRMTTSRLRGIVSGAVVTGLLNSSTITTVLLVGFVSAGVMTVAQTIPMIMGAGIGSTLTPQLVAFDLAAISPLLLAAGFALHAFGRGARLRHAGRIVLGFGLLFLGLEVMSDATRPLRSFEPFIELMQDMTSPAIGILIGAAFTAVVQSSAATLGIVIALGSEGLVPLEAGIALVLGANIGTVGTALLSSIGKSAEARQVAVVHLLFKVAGVALFVFLIPEFAVLVRAISPSHPELAGVERLAAETPRQIANAHTAFAVISTLVLVWFTGPLGRLAARLVPPAPPLASRPHGEPVYLDDDALAVPATAIQRTRLELGRLGGEVVDMVRGVPGVGNADVQALGAAILAYIGRASETEHGDDESRALVALSQNVLTLESVADLVASGPADAGDGETAPLRQAVLANLERAVAVIVEPDPEAAAAVLAGKPAIEALAVGAHARLLARLRPEAGGDLAGYRRASDAIELLRQVARYARAIAETAAAPAGVSARDRATRPR